MKITGTEGTAVYCTYSVVNVLTGNSRKQAGTGKPQLVILFRETAVQFSKPKMCGVCVIPVNKKLRNLIFLQKIT